MTQDEYTVALQRTAATAAAFALETIGVDEDERAHLQRWSARASLAARVSAGVEGTENQRAYLAGIMDALAEGKK